MIIELLLLGLITGFISGFFGVGGGMFLVPLLIFIGFTIKEAISISIMQMVFSSVFGSFLNIKKSIDVLKDGIFIGLGGTIGGLFSGYIISNVSNLSLQYLFITIVIFSIIRIFFSPSKQKEEPKKQNIFLLMFIGFIIGLIAMSIGVGGSIILTPILVGFMNYSLKKATSLGLFFVVFSSIGGFSSLSYHGQMLYEEGFYVGFTSLVGVYFGIIAKNLIHSNSYKKYILFLNLLVLILMISKTF